MERYSTDLDLALNHLNSGHPLVFLSSLWCVNPLVSSLLHSFSSVFSLSFSSCLSVRKTDGEMESRATCGPLIYLVAKWFRSRAQHRALRECIRRMGMFMDLGSLTIMCVAVWETHHMSLWVNSGKQPEMVSLTVLMGPERDSQSLTFDYFTNEH